MVVLAIVGSSVSAAVDPATSREQAIDQFLQALPNEADEHPAIDPDELSRLLSLNPGREEDIKSILLAYDSCIRPQVEDATKRYLRSTAVALGAAKVSKLTEFYRGADYQTYTRLLAKTDAGRNLTAAESASIARIMRTYPLIDLQRAMENAEAVMSKDPKFTEAATKCSLDKRAAFVRAGLEFKLQH